MLLSVQQRYILILLRQIKCLRRRQLYRLTKSHVPRSDGRELSEGAVDAMLRQLRHCTGDVILDGDLGHLMGLRRRVPLTKRGRPRRPARNNKLLRYRRRLRNRRRKPQSRRNRINRQAPTRLIRQWKHCRMMRTRSNVKSWISTFRPEWRLWRQRRRMMRSRWKKISRQ